MNAVWVKTVSLDQSHLTRYILLTVLYISLQFFPSFMVMCKKTTAASWNFKVSLWQVVNYMLSPNPLYGNSSTMYVCMYVCMYVAL